MRAGLIKGKYRLDFVEVPEPQVGPGVAVVDIERCGICGTDVAAFRDGHPYPPFLSGHEWCGFVSAVGTGVENLAVGDRVVIGSPPACGRCPECRAGITQCCARRIELDGVPLHGGYAPRIAVEAVRLIPIPGELSPEEAAQIEPATVALHAVRRSRLRLGDTVVIQGTGPVGLFALQLARLGGAGRLIAVEPNPKRRALAAELGADIALLPGDELLAQVRGHTGGLGADVVFECAGSAAALDTAVSLTRTGGEVMMIAPSNEPVRINPNLWLVREVTVTVSLAHNYTEFGITAGLLRDGRLRATPLHSKTVGLRELPATMKALADGAPELCKVLVNPNA